jgi:hypothetical protein
MFDMLSPAESKADEPLEEPENGEAAADPPDKEEVAVGHPPVGGVTADQLKECPHTDR